MEKAHKIKFYLFDFVWIRKIFIQKRLKTIQNITKNLKKIQLSKFLNECNINIVTTCKTTKQVKTKQILVENAKYSIIVKKRVQNKDKEEKELVKDFVDYLRNDFWKAKNNESCLLFCQDKFDLFTKSFL